MRRALFLLVLVALAAPASAQTARTEAAGLRMTVPKAWTRVPAPSDMRAAQYRVPRAAGDGDDAELVLFFFGPGKGGSVQDNLNRWYGQFTPTDGRTSRDAATVATRTVGDLKVTTVDLAGTYAPGPMGGPAAGPKTGYRMLAAIVEGEGGPWFLKLIGPAATVGQAKTEFDALIGSVDAHQ
jgi:hypothetical protein